MVFRSTLEVCAFEHPWLVAFAALESGVAAMATNASHLAFFRLGHEVLCWHRFDVLGLITTVDWKGGENPTGLGNNGSCNLTARL